MFCIVKVWLWVRLQEMVFLPYGRCACDFSLTMSCRRRQPTLSARKYFHTYLNRKIPTVCVGFLYVNWSQNKLDALLLFTFLLPIVLLNLTKNTSTNKKVWNSICISFVTDSANRVLDNCVLFNVVLYSKLWFKQKKSKISHESVEITKMILVRSKEVIDLLVTHHTIVKNMFETQFSP